MWPLLLHLLLLALVTLALGLPAQSERALTLTHGFGQRASGADDEEHDDDSVHGASENKIEDEHILTVQRTPCAS